MPWMFSVFITTVNEFMNMIPQLYEIACKLYKSDIEELVQMMSYRKLNGMLRYIDEARTNLKHNINFSTIISVMLMGFLEV